MNTDFRKGSHINFVDVFQQAKSFASLLTKKKKAIIQLLLCYETHEVAEDELSRSLDLLTHLDENQEYFKTRIGHGAIFLPRNQPLYAFCCFVIVPSLMAEKIHTRLPVSMGGFMPDLLELLEISTRFTNIEISETTRDEFIKQTAEIIYDAETKQKRPLTELVIFTGPTYNSDKVRSLFHKNVLFIANGSGHNPIVVTPTANINRAVESAMRVQLYNQGQDCAAPNSILVHQKILAKFLKQLHKNLSRVKVGPYANSKNTVGPITERKDLNKLCEILSENSGFLWDIVKLFMNIYYLIFLNEFIVEWEKEKENIKCKIRLN
ncbi:MAG: aldehyde dehydrogenase family protein [archaeon]